jgi:myo-inositol 2-dehydrogenase/D-chiro-inositol 1-dehydrogenase
MRKIRASLINSSPRFELCGIVDPQVSAAEKLAGKFDVSYSVSAFDKKSEGYLSAFHSPSNSIQVASSEKLSDAISETSKDMPLNGLVVSSPTFTHEVVVEEAGHCGISVFTEKPVDETAEKIERLFDYAAVADIDLCCGFQRRFDPTYVAATEAVWSGAAGSKVIMASLFFADHPSPPKEFLLTGGNIFMDLSAHDVDYIMHTLQDEVTSVYAVGVSSGRDLAAAGVHDSATMVMNFAKGS